MKLQEAPKTDEEAREQDELLEKVLPEILGEMLETCKAAELIQDFRKRRNLCGDLFACASCGMRDPDKE